MVFRTWDKVKVMKSELKVQQILEQNQIETLIETRYEELLQDLRDASFCSLLFNLYHDPFHANLEEFDTIELKTIDRYIRITHAYYLNTKLPEIEQCINHITLSDKQNLPIFTRLKLFFHAYMAQLESHIRKEEKGILAYSSAKINARYADEQLLTNFEEEHENIDQILLEVQDLVFQLQENSAHLSLLSLLSMHLEMLQLDLFVHGKMEDEVFLKKLRK